MRNRLILTDTRTGDDRTALLHELLRIGNLLSFRLGEDTDLSESDRALIDAWETNVERYRRADVADAYRLDDYDGQPLGEDAAPAPATAAVFPL